MLDAVWGIGPWPLVPPSKARTTSLKCMSGDFIAAIACYMCFAELAAVRGRSTPHSCCATSAPRRSGFEVCHFASKNSWMSQPSRTNFPHCGLTYAWWHDSLPRACPYRGVPCPDAATGSAGMLGGLGRPFAAHEQTVEKARGHQFGFLSQPGSRSTCGTLNPEKPSTSKSMWMHRALRYLSFRFITPMECLGCRANWL